jgi:hypothetical protein
MKRLLPATLLLALAAGACDSPTNGARVDRVVVTPDVRNVSTGDSVRLTATARDETSQVVDNVQFTWTSLEPAVATVTQAGMVSGLRTGTTRIEVSAQGKADTAVITVFGTAAECDVPDAGISLGVGQTVQRQGASASVLCLEGGAAGAEFTIIPFNGTPTPGSSMTLQVTGAAVSAPAGPPSPSVSPSLSGGLALDDAGGRTHDGGFHTRLNQRAAAGALHGMAAAARAAYARRTAGGARMQVAAAPPAVGTLLQLNTSIEACDDPANVTGRVAAVSQRAIIVADIANPAGGLTDADYAHVAATFDSLVYPVSVTNFGEPQDVDQNGRVLILYTRKVNELTPANSGGGYVSGFFFARDLFPRESGNTATAPCATSNYAEMFYMLAADPNGVVNGNERSAQDVFESTVGTVGHEFQHLINASRRLYVTRTDNFNEEVYLNEGLSHIAEELLFYHHARLSPRMNLGPSNVPTGSAARASLDLFADQNERRYQEYLRNPETRTPYNDDDDLADRGGAWAFLRYLADRRNGNDQQLWLSLVNNDVVGLANLREVLGQDPIPFFRDFAVSVYTDNAVAGVPAIFTQPSWNQRALLPAIYTGFQLKVRPLTSGNGQSFSLTAGGAAYLRAAVAPGRRASVTVRSGGPLDQDVWVTVVRTK